MIWPFHSQSHTASFLRWIPPGRDYHHGSCPGARRIHVGDQTWQKNLKKTKVNTTEQTKTPWNIWNRSPYILTRFFLLETFWFTEPSLHCPFCKNQDTESAKHVASRPKEVQEQRMELFLQLLYVAVLWWWPDLSRLQLEECAFSTQSSWSSLSSLGSGQVQNMPKLSKSEVELTPSGKSMSRWVEIPKLGCDNPKQYWVCVYININCIVYIIFRKKHKWNI